ncbi:ricin-type beta-trefoil lectin domain protein [Thalassospiraceae bacterium LMO-SO8]|nr:ricin-type beta-trefoil lectin domain protein [Alphaproteobacteria bacterium LMO-S08]WND76569.1 ricin-type beta-trefoil lectin domain protein [Thalassospiraceae bacterium LMO-SO8]
MISSKTIVRVSWTGSALLVMGMLLAAWVSLAAVEAAAETIPGRPICGGAMGNKLQPACDRQPAKFIGKARKDCPGGSFFDIGTWACFQCPSGYQRTANSVTEWDACSRDVPDQTARAKYHSRAACPSGAFIDPRNGGECWSCPSGYGRTLAAVDAWDACGAAFKDAKAATFRGKPCKTGWFDPRKGGECWSCPQGFIRTAAAVDQHNACLREVDLQPAKRTAALTCEAGDHFDFIDGGTCWRCPDNYERTVMGVKTRDACENLTIQWDVPNRNLPGLFRLKGAEALAIEVLQDRDQLNMMIAQGAKDLGKNPDAWVKEAWDVIAKDPAQSGFLSTAILMRAVNALDKPAAKRSPAERDLIQAIETGIRENRIFMADQARQMYENWLLTRQLTLAANAKRGGMSSVAERVGSPPDIHTMVSKAVRGAAGPLAQLGMGVMAMSNATKVIPAFRAFAPHSGRVVKQVVETGAKVTKMVIEKGVTSTGSSAASVAAAAAAPMALLTATMITIQMGIEEIAESEKMRITIADNLRLAAQPVRLEEFIQQKGGFEQVMHHWGIITSAPTKPSPAFFAAVKGATEPAPQTTMQHKPLSIPQNTPGVVIQSGVFRLALDAQPGLCLGSSDGKKLQLVPCNQKAAVTFQAVNGALQVPGGKCMDIAGESRKAGAAIMLWPCHGKANQQWTVSTRGELVSGLVGQCADVPGGRLVAGNGLQTWECNRTAAQKWKKLP